MSRLEWATVVMPSSARTVTRFSLCATGYGLAISTRRPRTASIASVSAWSDVTKGRFVRAAMSDSNRSCPALPYSATTGLPPTLMTSTPSASSASTLSRICPCAISRSSSRRRRTPSERTHSRTSSGRTSCHHGPSIHMLGSIRPIHVVTQSPPSEYSGILTMVDTDHKERRRSPTPLPWRRAMPWPDLRSFLDALDERGDLLRVTRPVDWDYEAVGLTRHTSDIEGPALLFDHVRDADVPCVSGLFAAKRRVAWALDVSENELDAAYREREDRSLPPTMAAGSPPCQEVVLTGDQIDLFKLPILRHYERDGGRYITAGLQVAKDPTTGTRNVSIHRMLLIDRNHVTVFAQLERHLRTIIERWHERGEPASISTAIGTEPATQIAS